MDAVSVKAKEREKEKKKMKKSAKRIASMLAAVMVLGACIPVYAEEGLDLDGVESDIDYSDTFLEEGMLRENAGDRNVFDVGSTDQVTISSDGSYSVTTGSGITMQVYPPFGWYCFTQDMAAQLELYTTFFNDPTSACSDMVQSGEHLFLANSDFSYGVSVVEIEDNIAALAGNSADLSDSDAEAILTLLKVQNPSYEVTLLTVGNNRYYKAASNDDSHVEYILFVKGKVVAAVIVPTGMGASTVDASIQEEVEAMLASDFSAM